MDMDQFQETLKNGVTLVDFNANWCAPCKAQEPVIKKLIKTYQNRASIIEINIDDHRTLATQYMVQSIPTLILFKDGKEIKRFVGLQSETTIAKSLDDVI
ncbi:MAG: thioredoxin [Desulfobacula sp.]|uniref:thioredoxin n=1 Tax=Desulfobacula sp. TaxID=2593537 RepID=UPI0025B86DE5|nr:thioredoxin [Desulfobacula sp.]MCD4719254.1 thioredoxin [Desulfobacula sp.]